ncbi:MAG TPA: FAD-dependent oxidoreductase [Solirubrobacterales bacterium]|nr:FAD-dependent oxidoreductase [Solirubrobacterales bacterium]
MKHTAHGYWLEEAGDPPHLPAAEGELSCDVLVVGGGYTGMWAAWQISQLEPEASVVLLEAERCGHGPSGRNGGFANAMWFSAHTLRGRFGAPAAADVLRAAQDAVDGIGRFCSEQGVDAWYRRSGYLQVSSAPAQDDVWREAAATCREVGEDDAIVELSAEAVGERCRSPRFRAGALYPGAATVQPARLAFGLRERLAERDGVRVFERSPLRRLRSGPWGCVAETPASSIRAGSCVLALGAGSGAAGSPMRGQLTVTSSHIVLTEPAPDLLQEIGWTGGECITDGRAMVHYMRTTPDGRIAFGWGGGRIACGARLRGRTEVDPGIVATVASHLRSFFPGLEHRRITHAWGGPIDVSPSHLPMIVPVGSDRAFGVFGYTGNGVGTSPMMGRIAASLALDRRDEHSRLAVVDPAPRRVPTGLPSWLGGNAIRAGLVAKEAAEERNAVADPLSRALAAIPERIGFHIGR